MKSPPKTGRSLCWRNARLRWWIFQIAWPPTLGAWFSVKSCLGHAIWNIHDRKHAFLQHKLRPAFGGEFIDSGVMLSEMSTYVFNSFTCTKCSLLQTYFGWATNIAGFPQQYHIWGWIGVGRCRPIQSQMWECWGKQAVFVAQPKYVWSELHLVQVKIYKT